MSARYCLENLHVRNTVSGECLECSNVLFSHRESEQLRANEPPPASVVMASGSRGTAWQRFADGLWHSTTGKRATWATLMLADRPGSRTRLIYLPPWSP